jgi:hypothetical protein
MLLLDTVDAPSRITSQAQQLFRLCLSPIARMACAAALTSVPQSQPQISPFLLQFRCPLLLRAPSGLLPYVFLGL